MLSELLRIVTPDAIVAAIKANPAMVLASLQKFETYLALGQAMTMSQQLTLSNNLHKLSDFFKTNSGKVAISSLADEFEKYVTASNKNTFK